MMKRIAEGAARIFLACGNTDFRKQIPGLVATVALGLKLDPYDGDYVFIFCNRKRDSIKVLRYDQNGFVLATKKLLDDMKFQWPRTVSNLSIFEHFCHPIFAHNSIKKAAEAGRVVELV